MKMTLAIKESNELESPECRSSFRSNGTRSRGFTILHVTNDSHHNVMECEGAESGK